MATPGKATLKEMTAKGDEMTGGKELEVQFNPESLRITYASQLRPPINSSRSTGSGASNQSVDVVGATNYQQTGPGSTRLSVQLWFDVTSVLPQGKEGVKDVRELTEQVAYFMKPASAQRQAPRGVQFRWGTLIFTGIMDSLDENLEFFSTQGVPLRASLNIGISEGIVDFGKLPGSGLSAGVGLSAGFGAGASLGAGTQPLVQAEAGVSLQAMASANFGANADWQPIATANGIENPRLLQPGQLINMNARASASADATASTRFTVE
jgi:hypothetical protein